MWILAIECYFKEQVIQVYSFLIERYGFKVSRIILFQTFLCTYKLMRGVTFKIVH